jgi:cystatin-C
VQDAAVMAAAEFAIASQRQSRFANGSGAALDLVTIESAERQVVAGVNYRLVLKVRDAEEVRFVTATVWWQPWRQPDPYRVIDWY